MGINPGDVSPAELRRQLDRLQVMYDLASAVGRAAAPEELYERALDGLQRAVGAERASVLVFDADGVMRFCAWRGLSDAYRAAVEGHSPWKREDRDAEPVLVPDVEADPSWGPYLPTFRAEGVRALGFVPLVYGGRLLGKFMLYYNAPHAFEPEEIRLARTIAAHIAFALERARADEVQKFLFEAGDALADSLDYDSTRKTAARLAVPRLADWCAVEMLGADGELEPLVVVHRDPDLEPVAHATRRRWPPRPEGPVVLPVLRSGESACIVEAGSAVREIAGGDEEYAAALRRVGLESFMAVPLRARGQVLGVMSFGSARATRRFGPEDLSLAEALAQRAAVAIEKARLYREACEASRIKDEFLATVSHELRTPLNAILGWARMLSQGQLEPARRARAVDAINRNADAQARLIEDILDVSRIVTGKVRIEAGPVDLNAVVSAAVESMRPAAEARALRLELRAAGTAGAGGQGAFVLGDADRLQQVVWNLVSNAIKFTPAGGSVEVSVERDAGEVCVRVADTGAGIHPDFLPYVFDRFRQADSSTRRAHGGLGLGLAIVRHLAELHGGSVRAQSAGLGLGATFTVHLPAARATAPREQTGSFAAAAPAAAGAASVAGLRVLVVDDEADARELAQVALSSGGALVTTAASVADAVAILAAQTPDVLVSDIAMPDEDGYDLIRRAAELAVARRGSRPPAVALTAYARDEDVRRAMAAGYDVHLAKPVDPAELLRVVARAAGR